ncbi:hypothetical protein [Arachnia propionica]|uniref:Uncharacterized protein n=1 Tax=Arachnia propionica TaxID=1750 RepID=A0A3P1WRE5_9ACTN|nr:hypothetical protein [Arachnia propionica]RRD48408.1 hypothetical protein EII35_13000 [Arachnia propionica]
MARDIGPEMLQFLDDAYAKGEIAKATYDAKRAEALAIIQRGEAVELEPLDRYIIMGCHGMAVVWFVLLVLGIGPNITGVLLGGLGTWLWLLLGRRVRRRGWPKR